MGLAWPQIIPIVKAAVDTALMVGLPEARIPLADAVVLTSTAPKSNSAYTALDRAIEDIRKGKAGSIPRNLQNKHYDGEDVQKKGQFYQYPHEAVCYTQQMCIRDRCITIWPTSWPKRRWDWRSIPFQDLFYIQFMSKI